MSTNGKFLTGLLLGAAAGASIALLLQSEKGQELLDNVKEMAEKATDEVTNLFNKGKNAVEENARKFEDVTA
ncbi:MAG: hypothetical protein JWN76_515 [Chitinophagaceae bacterium]|nr:hypothetical protein [Chitinophagaceae bacterium]